MSGSGTHTDVVAGAGRAVVLALAASVPATKARMTVPLGGFGRELRALGEAGTQALARGPREVDPATLMSRKSVSAALAMADDQAADDAADIGRLWHA